ncbi:MAG: hypothetical protein ACLQDV_08825 [Candidatus Binataceae bacterium]
MNPGTVRYGNGYGTTAIKQPERRETISAATAKYPSSIAANVGIHTNLLPHESAASGSLAHIGAGWLVSIHAKCDAASHDRWIRRNPWREMRIRSSGAYFAAASNELLFTTQGFDSSKQSSRSLA